LVVDNDIYNDETNLSMLKAIVDIHSQKDSDAENNFYNYDLDESQYERYKLLYSILKDADALDRTRGDNRWGLDCKYLRTESSKRLIYLSYELLYNYNEIKKRCK